MTSAQEVGWDMDGEDYEVHRPKYAHNKAMCTETRYADSYVTMTNRSPFAAMRPNPAGGAPVTKWEAIQHNWHFENQRRTTLY